MMKYSHLFQQNLPTHPLKNNIPFLEGGEGALYLILDINCFTNIIFIFRLTQVLPMSFFICCTYHDN